MSDNTPAIHGEAIAGNAYAVRKQLMILVGSIKEHTFDLAILLSEAKTEALFQVWGYSSLSEYAATELGLKGGKTRYLVRIVEVCNAVGISRTDYEPVGVSKLRDITRLKPGTKTLVPNPDTGEYEDMNDHIKRLVDKAEQMTGEDVDAEVKRLLGQTGPDTQVMRSYSVTQETWDSVVKPAFELTRKRLGSEGRDSEGKAKEYSDGAVLEVICADVLADPNSYPEDINNDDLVTEAPKQLFDIPTEDRI